MKYTLTNSVYWILALIISAIVLWYPPINTFSYDVFGYYMYLPLKFKYNDLAIQNFSIITDTLSNYHASETFYQAIKWENGNWIMRYPIGLAVLLSPFYFIADFITPYTSYPSDGFSRPYQLCILYGALLYALIGIYFVKKILQCFFDDRTSALTLLAIVLGTNFFFHVSLHGQGVMSHNFVYVLYTIIVYYSIRWHQTNQFKYIVILGLATALNALCRPTEIIGVLIPLLYGVYNIQTLKSKIQLLFKHSFQILTFGVIVIAIGFIQFGYWYSMSGEFIINPYGAGNPGEGLELLSPHLLEVLFSFRKGWFIYTPLMLFTVIGFWHMYKNNKILFTPVFIYFIINLYIVSCWSCWWYGACFGVRSLVPSYAALALPLGYFINYALNSSFKYIYTVIVTFFIFINLFQSWQLSKGIIDDSNMSRGYYFSTFLQTKQPTDEQKKLLLKGKFSDGIERFTTDDSLTHYLNFAAITNYEKVKDDIKPEYICDSISHSGKHSYLTNNSNPFGNTIAVPHDIVTKKSYTWIKASVWVYSNYPADSLDATFIIELKHNGYTFKYKGHQLTNNNFKPKIWNKLEYYYLTPDDLRSKKDMVRTLFWNKSKYPIYIDDLIMESYEPIIDKSVF